MCINKPVMGDLPTGKAFNNPSHDSQSVFRQILKSMAEPGSILTINAQIIPPHPLSIATAAICLSLLDFETNLWIQASLKTHEVIKYLKFHTGLKITDVPKKANFCILGTSIPNLDEFCSGTDDYPENGSTLIIQTDEISTRAQLQFEGPGIKSYRYVSVGSINKDFWSNREDLQSLFPRGLDLVFTQNNKMISVPRTTKIDVL
jgi:alpha-D-ribose 1-methylphosphonate 5-triphosphate synthase subunit PhnH